MIYLDNIVPIKHLYVLSTHQMSRLFIPHHEKLVRRLLFSFSKHHTDTNAILRQMKIVTFLQIQSADLMNMIFQAKCF